MGQLVRLLRKFDKATFIGNGSEDALPEGMTLADVDGDGTLWFLSPLRAANVAELTDEKHVTVVLQGRADFVVASGRAQLVHDPRRLRELWREGDRLWFAGNDDAELGLVSFFIEEAEIWDNDGSRGMKFLYSAPEPAVSGVRPRRESPDPARLAV